MAGLRKRDLQLLGVAAGAIAIFFVVRTAKRPRSQQPAAAPADKDTPPTFLEDIERPLQELGANTRSAIDSVLFKFQEFFKGERAPVDFT